MYYYSSIFVYCFAVVVNLSLSGANPAWNAILPLENEVPSSKNGITIVNGNNRIIVDQANNLVNRFGDGGSRKVSSISNIGNGLQNSNSIITIDGDQRTVITQEKNSNGLNTDGTSFVHTSNDGLDLYNVGRGSSNVNEVIINNKPAQTEKTGSHISSQVSSVIENSLKELKTLSEQLEQIVGQMVQVMHTRLTDE